MKLLGIDFGSVLDASGVRGFFGEGYPYHRPLKYIGLDFSGSTFVSKTATLTGRVGWLKYKNDGTTPAQFMPDCMEIKWRQGVVLNAIGLGNPGIMSLLSDGRWQSRTEPFFISVMPVRTQAEWRLQEFVDLMRVLSARRSGFNAPFGLQINLSCANVGLNTCTMAHEAADYLDVAAHFLPGVPLMPKFSVEVPPATIQSVADHRHCHAICVSNAVHWGALGDRIDWFGIFGRNESPLKLYGGGALSGVPLLSLVTDWVMEARGIGITKPINAGGGILSVSHAQTLLEAGADSIFLGSVAMLRPWRVRKIIQSIQAWK